MKVAAIRVVSALLLLHGVSAQDGEMVRRTSARRSSKLDKPVLSAGSTTMSASAAGSSWDRRSSVRVCVQPLPRRVQLKSTRGSLWGPVNIFSL